MILPAVHTMLVLPPTHGSLVGLGGLSIDLDADTAGKNSLIYYAVDGSDPTLIAPSARISGVGISEMSVVAAGIEDAEELLVIAGENIVLGTDGETVAAPWTITVLSGNVTITGAEQASAWQGLVRAIRYDNPAAVPTAGSRTFAITMSHDNENDSNTATATVTVGDYATIDGEVSFIDGEPATIE